MFYFSEPIWSNSIAIEPLRAGEIQRDNGFIFGKCCENSICSLGSNIIAREIDRNQITILPQNIGDNDRSQIS